MSATPPQLDDDLLAQALRSLLRREPRFRPVVRRHGPPALRASAGGLAALLRIVTEQFISLAAAAAIWNRVEAQLIVVTAENVLACPQEALAACGLTRARAKCFHALAQAAHDGVLDFPALALLPDDAARKALVTLPGIGPWTADTYLLTALLRPDAWPWGDVALQVAAQHLFDLPARPGKAEMQALGERFRPYRSVAARLLWSHYRHVKRMSQV